MRDFKITSLALGIVALVGIAWGIVIGASGGGWIPALGVAGIFILITGTLWGAILLSLGGFSGMKTYDAQQAETDGLRRRMYEAHVAELARLDARLEQVNERERQRQEQREQERANLIALREELLASK